jgi:L,D-transpeptidase catalytic domain
MDLPRQLRSRTNEGQRSRRLVAATITVLMLVAGAADRALGSPRALETSRGQLGAWRPWGETEIRPLDLASVAAAVPGQRSPAAAALTARASLAAKLPTRHPDQVLSNETTFTRWAYVQSIGAVFARPTSTSRRIARLHWYTEDGFPEIYLLLRAHWDAGGQEWVRLRLPMRPNGTTGWVRVQDLAPFHLTHEQIVVDRVRLRLSLYRDGALLWSAPVAVGKPSTPTPVGHYWIRERFAIVDPGSGYWPYAFGTSDYSTLTDWPGGGVVGIHGPYYQPWAIPGRVSHGCIRLRVADDAWLAHHISLGTPLRVL